MLSRHVPEEKLELGGIDALALAPEEAADQVVELLLKDAVSFLESFDLKLLTSTFLFKRFDTVLRARDTPTTRLPILYFRKLAFIPRSHFRTAQVDSVEQKLQSFGRE